MPQVVTAQPVLWIPVVPSESIYALSTSQWIKYSIYLGIDTSDLLHFLAMFDIGMVHHFEDKSL